MWGRGEGEGSGLETLPFKSLKFNEINPLPTIPGVTSGLYMTGNKLIKLWLLPN